MDLHSFAVAWQTEGTTDVHSVNTSTWFDYNTTSEGNCLDRIGGEVIPGQAKRKAEVTSYHIPIRYKSVCASGPEPSPAHAERDLGLYGLL